VVAGSTHLVVAGSAQLVVAGSAQLVVALVGNYKWDSLHRVDKRNTMVLLTQSSTPVIVAT
jgi:hypothetical protein